MSNPTNKEAWEKDFLNFYWMKGKYKERDVGENQYVKFIRFIIKTERQSERNEVLKGIGLGESPKKECGDQYECPYCYPDGWEDARKEIDEQKESILREKE